MAVTQTLYTQDNTEAFRNRLEAIGYVDYTVIADGFDDSPAQLVLQDAKTNLTTTVPVPPDSMVVATLTACVFADETTNNGHAVQLVVAAFRDGSGNVSLAEEVNTANTSQTLINEFQADTAAIAADIVFTIAANTTAQGIDISVAGVASSTNYLLGRISVVSARNGGLWKKYHVTN